MPSESCLTKDKQINVYKLSRRRPKKHIRTGRSAVSTLSQGAGTLTLILESMTKTFVCHRGISPSSECPVKSVLEISFPVFLAQIPIAASKHFTFLCHSSHVPPCKLYDFEVDRPYLFSAGILAPTVCSCKHPLTSPTHFIIPS